MLSNARTRRTLIAITILAVNLGGCTGRGESRQVATLAPPAAPAQATPLAGPTVSAAASVTPTAALPALTATPTAVPASAAAPATSAATAAPAAPQAVAPAASGAVPIRLRIPALKIDVAVVEMGWQVVQTKDGLRSEWEIPEDEAGRHLNSARLGEAGNLVISGHNNVYGQVFKPISLAWENDTRVKVDDYTDQSDVLNGSAVKLFDAAGVEYDYIVTGFYRLRETGASPEQQAAHARYMQPTDHEQVTIITCWPPTSNTHRLIVTAKPAQ